MHLATCLKYAFTMRAQVHELPENHCGDKRVGGGRRGAIFFHIFHPVREANVIVHERIANLPQETHVLVQFMLNEAGCEHRRLHQSNVKFRNKND